MCNRLNALVKDFFGHPVPCLQHANKGPGHAAKQQAYAAACTPSQTLAPLSAMHPGRFNARYERCAARFETACIGPARAAQARPSCQLVHMAVGCTAMPR